MTILKAFGQRAKEILHMAQSFASCAQTANVYVHDTIGSEGQADHDLLLTAAYLEEAARDLRQLHCKIHAMRQEAEAAQPQAKRIPVLTYGH